jgi:hypothetical protein
MSAYTGPDEYPIKQIPETPLWSENFAAMFTDSKSNLAVMWSCGRWLGDPTLWREFVMVSFPDGRFLYHRGYGRNADAKGPGGCFSKYDIVEPGKAVQLRFEGPMTETTSAYLVDFAPLNDPPEKKCVMDLHFDSSTPIWNMKGDSEEAQKMVGGIHIDHIGTANGTITHGGKTWTMSNGYAVRDHSRGVRDMRHYGAHNWINGSFPNGRKFYLYAAAVQGSSELGMSNASVEQDGKQYPAKVIHTEVINSTSFAGKTHHVVLQSELGEMRVDITKVLNLFPYSMVVPFDTALGRVTHRPAAILYDEFVSMRWNGVDGFGWSERGFTAQPLR